MNAKPFLIVVYQLLFAIVSIGTVTIIEGFGTEMFAGAFYFNLLYLAVGGIVNYLAYLILQRIYSTQKKQLLITHFLFCLLLMNSFSFFLNSSWITWTFIKGIFSDKDDRFWIAFVVHIIMIGCYLLAILITKKKMYNTTQNQTTC